MGTLTLRNSTVYASFISTSNTNNNSYYDGTNYVDLGNAYAYAYGGGLFSNINRLTVANYTISANSVKAYNNRYAYQNGNYVYPGVSVSGGGISGTSSVVATNTISPASG